MDLQRNALRPGTAEVRERDGALKEQRSFGAGSGHGQPLRRHHAQREPGVHDAFGQLAGDRDPAVDHVLEPDLFGVRHALVEAGERLA